MQVYPITDYLRKHNIILTKGILASSLVNHPYEIPLTLLRDNMDAFSLSVIDIMLDNLSNLDYLNKLQYLRFKYQQMIIKLFSKWEELLYDDIHIYKYEQSNKLLLRIKNNKWQFFILDEANLTDPFITEDLFYSFDIKCNTIEIGKAKTYAEALYRLYKSDRMDYLFYKTKRKKLKRRKERL